jgi:hypothetical protein
MPTVPTATPPTFDERRVQCELITTKILSRIRSDLAFLKDNGYVVMIIASETDQVVVPDPGPPYAWAYISTAQREDAAKIFARAADYLEAGLTTDPQGDRGQG